MNHGSYSTYAHGCRCPECTEATRLYRRKYRETHERKAYSSIPRRNPEHVRAQNAINGQIRYGHIERPTQCEAEGEHYGRIEAHHEDYNRPLDVTWLCSSHHKLRHRQAQKLGSK